MTEREALLKAVCDNPDDDTPRLVLADWLQEHGEEERAEFIRLQIEYAKRFELGEDLDDDADAFLASVLESNGSGWWLGPPPKREGVSFRMWRGFPFWIVAPNVRALKKAEHCKPGLMAVECLTIGNLTRDGAKYFAKRWYTPRIRLLEVKHLGIAGNLLEEFFSMADWSGLRYLSLRGCDLGYGGACAVADHGGFASLRVLDLRETEIANGGVAALCRSSALLGLSRLRMEGNHFLSPVDSDLRAKFEARVTF